jgi:diguanylate cyclase (GGDEF)-like protein
MMQGERHLLKLTNVMAVLVAVLVGVGPPAAYSFFALRHEAETIATESEARAHMLSDLIDAAPGDWEQQVREIHAALSWRMHSDPPQLHRLFTPDGRLLAETRFAERPAAPTLTRSLPVVHRGSLVGRLELRHSLRPLLLETLEVGLVAAALGLLLAAVFRAVPRRALRTVADQVAFLSNHDPLTRLPNRMLFRDRLDQALARVGSGGEPAALLILDLDHFKDVNDALGHDAGDRLLLQVAQRLQSCIRRIDTVARLGGDEFAIIQCGVTVEIAGQLAQRFIDTLAPPFDLDSRRIVVGASVGVTLCTSAGSDSAERYLRDADVALYRAKALGRGRCCFFEESMHEQLLHRRSLEQELRQALHLRQFEVHYQPQMSLFGSRMVGVEALVRWRHPERGLIPPAEFIPIAEESGLIDLLGEEVLRIACREATAWGDLRVAVNVSPAQLRRPGLDMMVASVLAETGFDPRRLELEMTESVLLNDTEANLTTLRAIKALGVRIAMDDFGTGYSSLGYLRRFVFDKIKIDRSFVRDLGEDEDASVIVNAIVALSHSLGMPVTAEGIETPTQALMLLRAGCDEGQGFFFAAPMAASALTGFRNRHAGPAPALAALSLPSPQVFGSAAE